MLLELAEVGVSPVEFAERTATCSENPVQKELNGVAQLGEERYSLEIPRTHPILPQKGLCLVSSKRSRTGQDFAFMDHPLRVAALVRLPRKTTVTVHGMKTEETTKYTKHTKGEA